MKKEIYIGNIKEKIYAGYAGLIFGVVTENVIEEGVCFVKIKENQYVRLDDILAKKKKTIIKDFSNKKGEIFVSDLIPLKELIDNHYGKTEESNECIQNEDVKKKII